MTWLKKTKAYLEEQLRQKITITPMPKDRMGGLPLFLSKTYVHHRLDLFGRQLVILRKKGEAGSPGESPKTSPGCKNTLTTMSQLSLKSWPPGNENVSSKNRSLSSFLDANCISLCSLWICENTFPEAPHPNKSTYLEQHSTLCCVRFFSAM